MKAVFFLCFFFFFTYFEISKAKEVNFFSLKKKGPWFVALVAEISILGGGR